MIIQLLLVLLHNLNESTPSHVHCPLVHCYLLTMIQARKGAGGLLISAYHANFDTQQSVHTTDFEPIWPDGASFPVTPPVMLFDAFDNCFVFSAREATFYVFNSAWRLIRVFNVHAAKYVPDWKEKYRTAPFLISRVCLLFCCID